MLKEHAPTFLDRGPLFPGTSCFPLSPDTNARAKKSGFPVTHQDQLNVIFSVLGTPTEEDLAFVSDDKALEYLRSFPTKQKADFKTMFPCASPDAIDFLEKTLKFNPSERITIDECLKHPLLTEVRQQEKEKTVIDQITFSFEDEEIDTEERLRELFNEQIKLLVVK
jgi:mitogen-activated protein kinase 1/3